LSLAGLVFLTGCQPIDPATAATTEYLTRLQPLLYENSVLAEQVLYRAAAIYNKAARPDQIADQWTAEVVPVAEHLHYQASFLAAPETWGPVHADLVSIWGDRADAYRSLGEAIRLADQERWVKSRDLANDATIREDQWFIKLNDALGLLSMVADPLP